MTWPNVKEKYSLGQEECVSVQGVFILYSHCREKEGNLQSRLRKKKKKTVSVIVVSPQHRLCYTLCSHFGVHKQELRT